MNKLKGWLTILCVLCLLTGACLADSVTVDVVTATVTEEPAEAEPAAESREPLLPIDFSKGKKPQADAFKHDSKKKTWSYEDPTISVKIEVGRHKSGMGCDYWVATVKIKDASQLRTASRDGFGLDNPPTIDAAKLAKRQNAVLAINGDYFCYTPNGLTIRQGEVYLDLLTGDRDVLLVDEDGDFHGVKDAKKGDIASYIDESGKKVYTINGKRVINSFFFGPLLVVDGKVNNKMRLRNDMVATEKRQRMAIAQVGPLEYKCICCASLANGNTGMDLKTFAGVVAKQNVKIAYNLDGGNSTMMIFNNKKVNPTYKGDRAIVDIIYFASAYDGE